MLGLRGSDSLEGPSRLGTAPCYITSVGFMMFVFSMIIIIISSSSVIITSTITEPPPPAPSGWLQKAGHRSFSAPVFPHLSPCLPSLNSYKKHTTT